MTILTICDKDFNTLAYLNKLEEGYIMEELNGQLTLSFVCDVDPLKTPYLYDENNFLLYEDDVFRVCEIEELHNTAEYVTVSVSCEHYSYDLIDKVLTGFVYNNVQPAQPITDALMGTPFRLRKCEITTPVTIQYDESDINSKQAILSVASNCGGEVAYYKDYIDLLVRRGADRGVEFRFGKNITSIKRTRNIKKGTISYDVQIEQGTEFDELGYFELGDTVRVVDERLGVEHDVRIVSLKRDIITGANSDVVLGDKPSDLRNSFSSITDKVNTVDNKVTNVSDRVNSSATSWDRIDNILDESNKIILGKLNQLQQTTSMIANSTGTYYQDDSCSCWQDQPTFEASTFATKWSAKGLMFANSKKNNDTEWDWQLAINADGVIATKVVASALYGLTVDTLNITASNIVGGSISGVAIEGSTMISGDNKIFQTYTKIDDNGDIIRYVNNLEVLRISGSNKDGGGEIILTSFDRVGRLYIDTSILDSNNKRCARIDVNNIGLIIQRSDTGQSIKLSDGGISIKPQGTVEIDGDLWVTGSVRAVGGIS